MELMAVDSFWKRESKISLRICSLVSSPLFSGAQIILDVFKTTKQDKKLHGYGRRVHMRGVVYHQKIMHEVLKEQTNLKTKSRLKEKITFIYFCFKD